VAAQAPEQLYLFTSNMRPLYEQDAMDVLAAPSGSRYRFRYQHSDARSYLGTGLVDRWAKDELVGLPVLVCFSIQQEADYHPSAFIPVRAGSVLQTRIEGSLCLVDFEIGKHASLPMDGTDKMGEHVKLFSQQLNDQLRETPDVKKSAVIGPPVPGLVIGDESAPEAWENGVGYLSRTLSFRGEIFIRYAGLREVGSTSNAPMENGVFKLTAGRSYELLVTHLQPRESGEVRRYAVIVDGEIINVVGETEVVISSRYDTIPITLYAPERDDVRETQVAVEPAPGVEGAKLRLRIRIVPNKARQVTGAVLTAISLALVALPGILGPETPWELRVGVALAGLLLGSFLVAARLKRA
jgi:hypothetical protein